jgi:hypothetical protein
MGRGGEEKKRKEKKRKEKKRKEKKRKEKKIDTHYTGVQERKQGKQRVCSWLYF